jgi:hypothetical protein
MVAAKDLPDPGAHRTGWAARLIGVRWCVGMAGNLDTVHDATLVVEAGFLDEEQREKLARWLAATYNAALGIVPPGET